MKFKVTHVAVFYFSSVFTSVYECNRNADRDDSCDHNKKAYRLRRSTGECPAGEWTKHNDKCYLVAKSQIDQPTAEAGCRSSRGHLVGIGSASENDHIKSLASGAGAQSIWIGLRYEDDNALWKWLSQARYDYSNWSDSQPAEPSSKRCVVMNSLNDGRWETRQCFPATADGYVCATAPVAAEEAPDPCQPNPCQNGGSCTSKDGNYTCTCTGGFAGPICSASSSACGTNPCQNGGTCVDGGTSYQCTCPTGYSGRRCEQAGPLTVQSGAANGTCTFGTCSNGGTCATTQTGFTCTCPAGYTGPRCETNANPCANNSCLNGGTCAASPSGAFTCTCPVGYTGPRCESSVNPCANNSCLNGGTCAASPSGAFACTCPVGYTGPRCETSVNPCANNSCLNGGTCAASPSGAFTCTCPAGYSGVKCETDINECTTNPCLNGGTCIDGVNEFTCKCAGGWSGVTCSQRLANCDPNPCKHNGRCYTLSSTEYICKCADGYVGEQCERDVNECDYGVCSEGETCLNTPGSYKCICQSQSQCKVQQPLYTVAADRNACASGPCKNSGACSSQAGGGYTCSCASGFSGSTCEIMSNNQNACNSNPCLNGGVCNVSGGRYTCSCPNGHSGQNCQYGSGSAPQTNTACDSNQCQNGGTCARGPTGANVCQCAKSFTGQTCAAACPSGWSWSNGFCYLANDVSSNYEQAAALCPRHQPGSYLLTVQSQSEFDYAAILMNQLQSNVWMGLKYDVSRAQFVWITGEALGVDDFKAWAPQQPKNVERKNCARITARAGFVWETEDCNRSLKLICKYKG